jgi:hypothetical protein
LLLFAHWKVIQDHQHQFAVALVSTIKQGTKSVMYQMLNLDFPFFFFFTAIVQVFALLHIRVNPKPDNRSCILEKHVYRSQYCLNFHHAPQQGYTKTWKLLTYSRKKYVYRSQWIWGMEKKSS